MVTTSSLLPAETSRLVEAVIAEAVTFDEALSKTDKDEVEKVVKRMLRSGELDDYTLKSIQGALTQLFKTFYLRRGIWKTELSLKQT